MSNRIGANLKSLFFFLVASFVFFVSAQVLATVFAQELSRSASSSAQETPSVPTSASPQAAADSFAQPSSPVPTPTQSPILSTPTPPPPTPPPPPPTGPVSLSVSPITMNLETKPGRPITSPLKIFNNGIATEYLQVTVATFKADGSGSLPVISDFEPTDTYQHWLSISEPKFAVPPKEWKSLTVQFSPPPEAALGYYYALIISRQTEAQPQSGTTTLQGAPAILVLTKVDAPNAIAELQVVKFKSKRRVYEFLPASFEVEVKNTGNIHLAPLGNIFIDGGGKKDVGLLSVNPGAGLVLPGSTRTYKVSWEKGFPAFKPQEENGSIVKDEKGVSKQKLHWDFSQINDFRFGKYTASLLLIYDNGERDIPIESELSFWVIPWRIIVGFGAVGLLLFSGIAFPFIYILRRTRRRKGGGV